MSNPQTQSKILIVINELWIGGGAEKTAAQLANHLTQQGHTVRVVVLYDGQERHQVDCAYTALGQVPTGKFDKITRLPQNLWQLRNIVRAERPDTVLCFLEEASFSLLLSTWLFALRTRIIVSVRNNVMALHPLYRIASKYLYRRAAAVVCVTKRIAHDMETKLGLSNTTTIYNSVDVAQAEMQAAKPLAAEHVAIFQRGPTALAIGRLAPQKGYRHLLHAFAEVRKELPRAQLVIVGEGPQRDELQTVAEQLKLTDAVHFVGLQANVYNLLAAADVYALSSHFEGMPNTMLEALAIGLPVVSTDCVSGPREIIAPELHITERPNYPVTTQYGTLVAPLGSSGTGVRDVTAPLSSTEAQFAKALQTSLSTATSESGHRTELPDVFTPTAVLRQWDAVLNQN